MKIIRGDTDNFYERLTSLYDRYNAELQGMIANVVNGNKKYNNAQYIWSKALLFEKILNNYNMEE